MTQVTATVSPTTYTQIMKLPRAIQHMTIHPIHSLLNLSGKSAIVTGGAKGIGYGISYRLAEAGAKVLIADIDEESANKSAKELIDHGWHAEAIKCDVSDESEIQSMVSVCQDNFGSIDILVNNAGIYPLQSIKEMTVSDFDLVLGVNLRSVFLATKYASAIMRKQAEGGRIINITSIDALHPSQAGLAHYDASKHAVWGFTQNAALELAQDKIWVNAIAPGGIYTPGVAAMSQKGIDDHRATSTETFLAKIPMHRFGEADEIGKVALFLASDMATYITGTQIVVDGGVLLS